jgi:hypothetical protein
LWKQALNRACPLISTCWITQKDESSRSTRSTHAARTNHSWQVFLTTVGFQRILYICLFFKWYIYSTNSTTAKISKVYTIHYSLLGSTSCSEIHWDKKTINAIHHFFRPVNTHRNGESLAGHVWKVVRT